MANKNERFKVVYKQTSGVSGFQVVVDSETGVNYMFEHDGYAGGLTPLLDKDGKPVVTPVTE